MKLKNLHEELADLQAPDAIAHYLKENGIYRCHRSGYDGILVELTTRVGKGPWFDLIVRSNGKFYGTLHVPNVKRENSRISGTLYDPESLPRLLEFVKKYYES